MLGSRKAQAQTWEYVDLLEAIGERIDSRDNWNLLLYSSINDLNEKVELETGLKKFFIHTMKTVTVNPMYLK